MPKIIISRESQSFNKLRDYEIYIDNIRTGLIGNGEEKTIKATLGMHEIYAKIDLYKSEKLIIDLTEEEELRLRCGTKITGAKQAFAPIYLFFPKEWVYLEYEYGNAPNSSNINNESNTENKAWQEIKSKGKNKFILKYGIIRWGIPTGIFYSILMQIFEHRIHSVKDFIMHTAINLLIISLFGGSLFGLAMWNVRDKNNS
jgi:hypothetical protein